MALAFAAFGKRGLLFDSATIMAKCCLPLPTGVVF